MILSFADKRAQAVFERQRVRGWSDELQRAAYRKLLQIDAVDVVDDLRVPPGNRLEKLGGDRKGQYSIRINDQYRVCFVWTGQGAADVEIVDYH